MQVKVSYTSDLEDIPDEVANIINTLTTDITNFDILIKESVKDLQNSDIVLAKIKMKLCSQKLQKMFARLTDCQVILDGYEKVKNPTQEQKQQPETE
jgi:hypothetical protein